MVWLVAAPAVEVRGAPGGLPRVGLPAQLALRPGPATRAAPQRRLRHAVRPRLPGCPGHGRWTRAGGRAFLTGRPNPRPAAWPPPDSGVAGLAAWREVTAGGPCVLPAGTTGPGGVCGAAGSASADRHCVGACARHHGVWLSGGSAARTLSERVCFERLVSSSNFKKLSDQRNREQF